MAWNQETWALSYVAVWHSLSRIKSSQRASGCRDDNDDEFQTAKLIACLLVDGITIQVDTCLRC